MPNRAFDEITTWAQGVVNSASPDQLPPGASPRGHNTFLTEIGEGTAVMGKRLGAATLNLTPLSGSPGIIGGFQFKKKNGTFLELLISDTGRIDKLNTDGTTTTINATGFTSGVHYPIFAVANDLCFIVNDVDQKKYDGTSLTNFGITRPAAPTAAAASGGGMALDTWDVGLTYFNSATGNESSLSDFTTVTTSGSNLQINVSWSAPTDPQVTHVRVYIRQESVGANIYQATAGATPAPGANGFAVGVTATVLNITALQYAAFITLAPGTSENNPPPSGAIGPTWHQSRMFLFDSGNIYYSNIKNNAAFPEAFNALNVQPVNPNDGDRIVGLFSAFGRLFIFKRFSLWQLAGTDPNSWFVSLVSNDFGLSTMRSLLFAGGALYWWAGAQGLVGYDGTSQPLSLGKQFLSATIAADTLNQTALTSMSAVVDQANETLLFSVPELGQTRNTRIIPFNYRLKRFAADVWNPFDTYSLWTIEDATHLQTVHMGNYAGQAFQWWSGSNDGVPSGTAFGKVTSSGNTTLTDSTAAFLNTGGKLIERAVYAISSDGLTIQRRRITANTATQLTISSAWDTNPNTDYTYIVGGIDFQLDTAWMLSPDGFMKKRFEFLLTQCSSTDVGAALDVDIFISLDTTAPKRTLHFPLKVAGSVFDASTSIYDSAKFAGDSITYSKLRVATVGRSWRARYRNIQPSTTVLINRVGMQSVPMSIKS